jgi:hypothetical protein
VLHRGTSGIPATVSDPPGRPAGAHGTRYAAAVTDDPTRRVPVDPWAGSAPVVPPGSFTEPEPYVIVVERPRKRRWPWVIGTFAALALVCCIGAIAVWTPISKEYPAYVEVGTKPAGLDRVSDPEVDRASAELVAQMFRMYKVDDGDAALLADPAVPERRVILIAATKLILDPKGELDKAIRDVADRPIRDLTDYGRLGVTLKCAKTEDDNAAAVIICAWIDHGSIGLGIYYGAWTMDASATMLRDLRAAVVRRGQR